VELDGKVALVTGGNSGIGRAISEAFAREKARVMIGARNVDTGKQTVEAIQKKGGTASFVRTDVQDSSQVKNLVEETVARYGTVDIVCHCAGTELVKLLVDTTEEEWDRVMNTNVKGAYLVSKYALPHMIAKRKGTIIIFQSPSGSIDIIHRVIRITELGGTLYFATERDQNDGKRTSRVSPPNARGHEVIPECRRFEKAESGIFSWAG